MCYSTPQWYAIHNGLGQSGGTVGSGQQTEYRNDQSPAPHVGQLLPIEDEGILVAHFQSEITNVELKTGSVQ